MNLGGGPAGFFGAGVGAAKVAEETAKTKANKPRNNLEGNSFIFNNGFVEALSNLMLMRIYSGVQLKNVPRTQIVRIFPHFLQRGRRRGKWERCASSETREIAEQTGGDRFG